MVGGRKDHPELLQCKTEVELNLGEKKQHFQQNWGDKLIINSFQLSQIYTIDSRNRTRNMLLDFKGEQFVEIIWSGKMSSSPYHNIPAYTKSTISPIIEGYQLFWHGKKFERMYLAWTWLTSIAQQQRHSMSWHQGVRSWYGERQTPLREVKVVRSKFTTIKSIISQFTAIQSWVVTIE